MEDGGCLVLESLRCLMRVRLNSSEESARELSSFGEVYISDAFGACQ